MSKVPRHQIKQLSKTGTKAKMIEVIEARHSILKDNQNSLDQLYREELVSLCDDLRRRDGLSFKTINALLA